MSCCTNGEWEVDRGERLEIFAEVASFGGSGAAAADSKNGNLLQQADVTSISIESWAGGVQVGSTTALVVASTIYDTAQTTTVWARLGTAGGNARIIVPASLFDTDETTATVLVTFTLLDTTKAIEQYEVTIRQPPG